MSQGLSIVGEKIAPRAVRRVDMETYGRWLDNQEIEAPTFWVSLSAQAPYAAAPRRFSGVSAILSGRVVSLPCSSHLTGEEQEQVIAALDDWHGAGRLPLKTDSARRNVRTGVHRMG